jgi:hypothetical protein
MESRLSIELLGPPRFEHGGKPIVVDTRKAIGLLAYLALAPGPQRRSSLAALLWPDSDQAHARTALRRTLAALNKAIGREWLEVDRSASSCLLSGGAMPEEVAFELVQLIAMAVGPLVHELQAGAAEEHAAVVVQTLPLLGIFG